MGERNEGIFTCGMTMWMPLCSPNFVFVSFEMDSLNDFLSSRCFVSRIVGSHPHIVFI